VGSIIGFLTFAYYAAQVGNLRIASPYPHPRPLIRTLGVAGGDLLEQIAAVIVPGVFGQHVAGQSSRHGEDHPLINPVAIIKARLPLADQGAARAVVSLHLGHAIEVVECVDGVAVQGRR
jgi:hypothetical protein